MLKFSKNIQKFFFVKENKRIWWNIFENIYQLLKWSAQNNLFIGFALVGKDLCLDLS
jgi:hypothetical protein